MIESIDALIAQAIGFEWDPANEPKFLSRHGVTRGEVEQVFFHVPLLLATDLKHSAREVRYLALGRTTDARHLKVVFTIREQRIRPISARDLNRKERRIYADASA